MTRLHFTHFGSATGKHPAYGGMVRSALLAEAQAKVAGNFDIVYREVRYHIVLTIET